MSKKQRGDVYYQIGDLIAEAMGLTEMRDKTHAEQKATVDRARLATRRGANAGTNPTADPETGVRRPRSAPKVEAAARKRENRINKKHKL